MKRLLLFLLSLTSFSVVAQQSQEVLQRQCANHDVVMAARFPEWKAERNALEEQIQSYITRKANSRTEADEITLRIPVVVHVIHNNSSGFIGGANNANISDAQIFSQITVLNEDFRKKNGTNGWNTNLVGADMNIEFYMATEDPNGNPTTGIVRKYNNANSYDPYNDGDLKLASISSWTSDKYLNIWVVPKLDGTIGFAQFPYAAGITGLSPTNASATKAITDGIYVPHQYFGRNVGTAVNGIYNLGRVATHEIGHWLGLIHTWGDDFCGTDYCNDTPICEKSNLTNYCDAVYSTCVGTIKTKNMIENYMDYSPDKCMNIFTNDQKNRARAVMNLATRRKALLNYWNKSYPQPSELAVTFVPNPATDFANLQVYFKGTSDVSYTISDMQGRLMLSGNYPSVGSNIYTIGFSNIPNGLYILRVVTSLGTYTEKVAVVK